MLKKIFSYLLVLVMMLTFCLVFVACEDKDCSDKETEECTEKTTEDKETTTVDEKEIWNEVCPVMGNEVDKEAPTVVYEGKVYGFCCSGCDDKFKDDPEKYVANLSEDGKTFVGEK